MADSTFKINIKPAFVENTMLQPDENLISASADKMVLKLQEQELYKVDAAMVDLKPAYDKEQLVADTEITHVDKTLTLFKRHLSLFNSIREKIAADDEETALHKRLQLFIEKWRDDPQVQSLLGRYFATDNTNKITITRDSSALPESIIKISTGDDKDNDSSALFKLSRFAMNDFHRMSSLRRDFSRLKRLKTLALRSSLRQRSRFENQIEDARGAFENSEKSRIEAEENYAIVRGLLEEQLQAVDDSFAERHRILSRPLGLCYVRISDLPMQISYHGTPLLAEPSAGQLPASCQSSADLPERLQPFLELLMEQPMSSWRQLRPYWRWLPKDWLTQPPVQKIPQFQQSISVMPAAFHVLLTALPALQQRKIQPKRDLSLSAGSKRLADEVTLEQLANARHAGLRRKARHLQDNLASAISCLLQQLQEMPAVVRYQWSRLAENDRLNTENLLSWPDFHTYAGQAEGLYLREIVEWLYLQLDRNAMTESRSAMRTLVRACLLQAVNDDPEDLLHGKVVQFPGFIKPGVLMTATLNRVPHLSSRLKVYDGAQQLIAEARVVDSQETQANIEIISTYVTQPAAFAAWTVVGHKAQFNVGVD